MANKLVSKRSKRRRKPKPFGVVHSYYRTYSSRPGRSDPNEYGHIVKHASRGFESYEAAMAHVAGIKLGIIERPYPYNYYTPYKVTKRVHTSKKGHNKRTKTLVSTVIEEPPKSRTLRGDSLERFSEQWYDLSGRQSSYQRRYYASISKAVAKGQRTARSGGLSTGRRRTTAMGRSRVPAGLVPNSTSTRHHGAASSLVQRKRLSKVQQIRNTPLARARKFCYR